MKVILYGEPYYIRTVLRCLDYTNPGCSEIYLADAGIVSEFSHHSSFIPKYSAKLLDDEILNDSSIDEMVVISSENIKSLIPPSISHSKQKLKFIRLDMAPQNKFYHAALNNSSLKGKPSILSLSIGNGAQQYFSELLINRNLRQRGIRFIQLFSPESAYLLSADGINSTIAKESTRSDDFDIFVGGFSVNCSSDLTNMTSPVCKAIERMNPDSVVISCCNCPSRIENEIAEAVNILRYRYHISEIILMISEYFSNCNFSFPMRTDYRPKKNEVGCKTFYLSDIEFNSNEEIVDLLLSSVYLPDGFIPIT